MPDPATGRSLFSRGSWAEARRAADILRSETVAGTLLIAAAVVALVWANTPWSSSYFELREVRVGPAALHLDLTLAEWSADGLLAIFFFLAGLELKREFVCGDLRDPRRAAIPVAAAVGGMIVPALVFVAINAGNGTTAGWAIPIATDIAFSLAVLAVLSTHLPSAVRTFLLALAVVDDLLAIVVIAVFFTDDLQPMYLLMALVPIVIFGLLWQLRMARWWSAIPLALVAWGLVHASGVHATVAGVLLAFVVPVKASTRRGGRLALPGAADELEHRVRPVSSGFAVPVFAFFASGVALGGLAAFGHSLGEPVTLGVILGLVLGKPVGVLLGIALAGKALRSGMDPDASWSDAFGAALLCGIGFTVSLLIGELAFQAEPELVDQARIGVLGGSLLAAAVAAMVLRRRNRHYRELQERESLDTDADGIPDVYEGR
jgi:NhaA family Na+:H+ antiporter